MLNFVSRKLPFAFAVFLLGPLAGSSQAGFVYDSATGYYYGLTSKAESWTAAEAEAESLGGHLASIPNQAAENFIIANFLQAPQASAVPYWIGLEANMPFSSTQDTYSTWSDGTPLTYTDWNTGEPNDNGGQEHYVAINWHYAEDSTSTVGTWNDTPLNGTTGFGGNSNGPYFGIMEVRTLPGSVPEPSSLTLLAIASASAGLFALRRRLRG